MDDSQDPERPTGTADADPVRVSSLHVAADRHAPMTEVGEVVAEAGLGLVGDRFHGSRHRHVSVQSATELAAAQEQLGSPVPPVSTRRNVTLSHGEVPTRPGDRITVGDVVLELVRVAAPCRLMETSVGPGARTALRRRGGAIFRVLDGGTIRVGDAVDLDPAPADDGHVASPTPLP